MTTKSKVPHIRFKGFSGELDEKKLCEISSVIFDGTHQTPIYTDSGIPFFSVENLISKSKNKFISQNDYIEATKKNKPEKNDILITRIGNIGFSKVVTWEYDFSIYVTLAVVKQSNIFNSFYLNYYMQSARYQAEIMSKSLLSAVPCKINMNELRNTNIILPKNLTEQTKIGDYFQQLDKLIEQKEEKYQKLKQFKKAMLSKMFPKNGANTPEIRFKGFSGKWEEKKLKEVSTFYNGRAYKQEELLKNGKYRVLRVGNFFTNDSWYYSDLELEENKYCDNGDLLYAWSASFGPRIWDGEKVIYHYHIWKVENHEDIIKQFLFIVLDNETVKMKTKNANGFALLHITKETIENWKIKLPLNLDEQTKIGNYFQKLDNQIELQLQEIEKLKNIKKASLSKMFV